VQPIRLPTCFTFTVPAAFAALEEAFAMLVFAP
jgi:hypothetical protein